MKKPAYLTNLKKLGDGVLTKEDISNIEAEVYSGPDRAAAVVLGSFVERGMADLLASKMNPSHIGKIFDFSGPLGTFSAKIDLAYAFNLIGPTSYHDLNLIRLLRNAFAHTRIAVNFQTSEVVEVCKNLKLPDEDGVKPETALRMVLPAPHVEAALTKPPARIRFFMSCHEIQTRIIQAIHGPREGDRVYPNDQPLP